MNIPVYIRKILGILTVIIVCVGLSIFLSVSPAWAATQTVTISSDSGAGSLRNAIQNAASGDTVSFSLPANSTITLSSSLVINKDLIIDGSGVSNLTISGNNVCRVFEIDGGNVTIKNLTIANGYAIGNSGSNGSGGTGGGGGGGGGATGGGGGLLVKGGSVCVTSVNFLNNRAIGGTGGGGGAGWQSGGSGIGGNGGGSDIYDLTSGAGSTDPNAPGGDTYHYGGAGGGCGGGQQGYGSSGGTATDYYGQGGNGGNGGNTSSEPFYSGYAGYGGDGGNGGNGCGGAICYANGTLAIAYCSFTGNTATGGTGGYAGSSNYTLISGNDGLYFGGHGGQGGDGKGGAIFIGESVYNYYPGDITIVNSSFSGNSAVDGTGGAVASGGPSFENGITGSAYANDIYNIGPKGAKVANLTGDNSNNINSMFYPVNVAGSQYSSTSAIGPTSVTTDGTTSSMITVTLYDAGGHYPVFGDKVTLNQGNGQSIISPSSAVTDLNGTATFTVTDTHAETVTYTAADTTSGMNISGNVTVNFTTGQADSSQSTVTASPSTGTYSVITVTLKDANGNLVRSGKNVTLSAGGGSSYVNGQPNTASATTDGNDQVSFTVTDTAAESVTYTAIDTSDSMAVAQTATVAFTAQGWVVNSLNDDGSPGTLRYAVQNASSGAAITFSVTGTIVISSQLSIAKDLTISGPGAGNLTIRGNNCRVFEVDSGTVSIQGITIDGEAIGSNGADAYNTSVNGGNGVNANGGGLYMKNGKVTIDSVDFTGCRAVGGNGGSSNGQTGGSGGSGEGGGICIDSGSLTVTNSRFNNNSVIGGNGGGGFNGNGSGNNGYGGAIYIGGGSVTITNGQFDGDGATGGSAGAGYNNYCQGYKGNGGSGKGGAIYIGVGSLIITGSQFTNDSVTAGTAGTVGWYSGTNGTAAATDLYNQSGALTMSNVTLGPGNNSYYNPSPADAGQSAVTASPDTVPADGTTTSKVTVLLKDLNGSPVSGKTVTLSQVSGNSKVLSPSTATTDNNGLVAFYVTDTNTETVTYTATDTTDSNMMVTQTAAVTFASYAWTVNSLKDDGSSGTLRYVINNAPPGTTITFQSGLTGTIVLSSMLPKIDEDLTIDGSGADVTISGNNQCRVFEVDGGTVSIKNITIAGGKAVGSKGTDTPYTGYVRPQPGGSGGSGNGGGLLITGGTVNIEGVSFNDNQAVGGNGGISGDSAHYNNYVGQGMNGGNGGSAYGGAICLMNGLLTISDSQFRRNSAAGGNGGSSNWSSSYGGSGGSAYGGAIYVSAGSLTITGSQFLGNCVTSGSGGSGINAYGYGGNGSNGSATGKDIHNLNGTANISSNVTYDSSADPGESIITAKVNRVPADGTASSTITVVMKYADGSPVSDKTVSLSQGSGSSNITPVSNNFTDSDGIVAFIVTNTKPETVSYTAVDITDNITLPQTVTVTFLPPDMDKSTITASVSTIPADGDASSTITVILKDADGSPVVGKTVTISQGTGNSKITPVNNGLTDGNGTAVFTVTDMTPETVTYTARDITDNLTLPQTVAVTFSQSGLAVNTLSDDGSPGTLRFAIANSQPGTTITFRSGLAGTILLNSTLPAINKDLTIDGSGAGVTISGNNQYRVFQVDGGTVSIKGLTITDGKVIGSNGKDAGYTQGSGGNGTDSFGGGLLVIGGTVSIDDVSFNNNHVIGGTGGNAFGSILFTFTGGTGGSSYGGAVYLTNGSLLISNSTFTGNTATGGTGGSGNGCSGGIGGSGNAGAIYDSTGSLTITDSRFFSNTATGGTGGYSNGGDMGGNGGSGSGGAIYVDSGSLKITDISFSGGSVTAGGGGSGSLPGSPGSAAATDIYNQNGAATISNVTFDSGTNSYYNLPLMFAVTYDSQGGNAVSGINNVTSGSTISEPAAPVQAGYAFGGWYKESSCTNEWNFSTDTVTGDITLYAKWTVQTHTVTFQDWDGTVLKVQTVNDKAAASAPSNPGRTGYFFTGWDISFSNVTSDLTVTAQYSQNPLSLTMSPDNGVAGDTIGFSGKTTTSSAITVQVVKADGTEIYSQSLTTDTSGNFSGKFKVPDGMTSGILYGSVQAAGRKVSANVLVHEAAYVPPVVISTPTVTVSTNGSNKNLEIPATASTTSAAITVNIPAAVTDATISVSQMVNSPVDGVVTTQPLPAMNIEAVTALSSSPVKVDIPAEVTISAPASSNWDGTINVPTVKANNTVSVSADAGKTATVNTVIEVGYGDIPLTFNKAVRLLIPGMAGKDAGYTRNGSFTKITQILSADSQNVADAEIPDGGEARIDVGSDMVIWTKHFTSFVAYTQANSAYSSDGGGDSSQAAQITVTFKDWDGSVLKTDTVNYGAAATAPVNPSRTGYTFTGWDKTFNNVTSDLTVMAQYSPIAIDEPVIRLVGTDRIETALKIAQATYPGKIPNAILATADNYPDALAGSVLANQLNAPILLIGSSEADQEKVLDYLKSNLEPEGTVYLLGGTGVIDKSFEDELSTNGINKISRLAGADRYETSAKIADQLGVKTGTPLVLVSGENYPDALSVSSIAAQNQYPILLVSKDGISDTVSQAMAAIKPDKVYIIGLEGAISPNTEKQVARITGLTSEDIVRIGGADRYATSLAIAKYFNSDIQTVCVATGNNFPDALAGSVYAAKQKAPIILTDSTLSVQTLSYLESGKPSGMAIFGGEAAVGKDIEQQLNQLLNQ